MGELQTESWQLRLFGRMELFAPSGERVLIDSRKCSELLAYLALRRSDRLSRDQVAEALWPDCDPISARNRLKQTLTTLRKYVADLPIVCHGKHEIELSKSLVHIDLHAMERRYKWLRTLRGRSWEDAARLILATTRDGLLQGMNAAWIEGERHRYQEITCELESQLTDADPEVMTTFRLGDQLGILRVPIVGRAAELSQISQWLAEGVGRRLILVGPPGVGKTRLLAETLASREDLFDAVVTLSTTQFSETPWRERLAQAAEISDAERFTRDLTRLLRDFKRPLLAIDDCDQADPSMTEWVERLLAEVPRLKMMGSARRHPDDDRAEVLRVAPLQRAGPKGNPAADLLIRFAAQAGVSDELLCSSRSPLEEMAELLEGLPLSLEIMAGWMPTLGPESLLARLRSGSEMLVQGKAKGRGSLAEIFGTILRSMSPAEVSTMLFLSLCKSGCGERLAEAALGLEWPWSFRALSERSLISQVPGSSGMRFLVLQAIRESVQALLSPEATLESEENHSQACMRLGMVAAWGYAEGDRRMWLNWMRDEADNLLASCSRCSERQESAPSALELLRKLRHPFWLIGRHTDHERVATSAMDRWYSVFDSIDHRTPALLIEKRFNLLISCGRLREATELVTQYRAAQSQAGNLDVIAVAFDFEAQVRFVSKAYEKAMRCYEEASKHHLAAGRNHHALWVEADLARAELRMGLTEMSLSRKQRAFKTSADLEDFNSEGMYGKEFAVAAIGAEEWQQARKLAEQSVRAFERAGEIPTRFEALLVLAAALIGSKENQAAASVLDAAERDSAFISDRSLQKLSLLRRARIKNPAGIDLVKIVEPDY
jgi:tetratricopeptide (TPR) repeat protein